MLYWEDLVRCPAQRYGPLAISTPMLDAFLDLVGERHPIHVDDCYASSVQRNKRVVPAGLIHSATSGCIVQNGGAAAVIGLRSLHWDFVRPLYPDVEFYFTNEVKESIDIGAAAGLIKTERRVMDTNHGLLAVARLETAVQKYPS